jgi:hypothetical protein
MKEITITSLNEKGYEALQQHIAEFKKMKLKDRLIFKAAGYTQEVISENPYTILLTVNNRQANNPMFLDLILGEIDNALLLNGAVKDIDYKTDIKQEAPK